MFIKTKLGISIVFAIMAFFPIDAHAALIAEYDIQNRAYTSSTIEATNLADNVTAEALKATGVSLLSASGYNGVFVAKGWNSESSTLPNINQYYEWSISPEDGISITYSTIGLSLVRGNYQSGTNGHGPDYWQLRASTTNFSTYTTLQNWDISNTAMDTIVLFTGQDISELGTQSIEVVFRLYGYHEAVSGEKDYAGLAYAHNDLIGTGTNLKVYGTVIPEPVTTSLFTIGGFAIVLYRRKRIA